MQNQTTIKCPNCKTELSVEKVLYSQLESEFTKDMDEKRVAYHKVQIALNLKIEEFFNRNLDIFKLYEITNEFISRLILLEHAQSADIPSILQKLLSSREEEYILFTYKASAHTHCEQHLSSFINRINITFNTKNDKKITYWTNLFIYLKRTIQHEIDIKKQNTQIIIFIDEILYLDEDFLNSFGYFYNIFCQREQNFLVILGGSNIEWSDYSLRLNTGALYQRFDERIKI